MGTPEALHTAISIIYLLRNLTLYLSAYFLGWHCSPVVIDFIKGFL